MTLYYLKVKII